MLNVMTGKSELGKVTPDSSPVPKTESQTPEKKLSSLLPMFNFSEKIVAENRLVPEESKEPL